MIRGLLAAATGVLVAGSLCGCSLILDFDDSSGDDDDTDAGGLVDAIDGDAGDACANLEPNDDISSPTVITPDTYFYLAICPGGDRDFYRFTLDAGQDMVLEILFDNMGGRGDLELRLFDGTGTKIDESVTFDDNERIERSVAMDNQLTPGDYTAEVFGIQMSTQNTYDLVLTVTTP